jgi:hypothetical protein
MIAIARTSTSDSAFVNGAVFSPNNQPTMMLSTAASFVTVIMRGSFVSPVMMRLSVSSGTFARFATALWVSPMETIALRKRVDKSMRCTGGFLRHGTTALPCMRRGRGIIVAVPSCHPAHLSAQLCEALREPVFARDRGLSRKRPNLSHACAF